ncbi:MAG: paraquat-inducible protein A [Lautropia sp.]|nr:paraquat-inducible protein A [Lautropia sp.]
MCDTLHRRPRLTRGQTAHCRVCGVALGKHSRLDRTRITPLVLACLVLFVIANAFPIVMLEMQGSQLPLTLAGSVLTLLDYEMIAVAVMVFLPTLLLPGLYLVLLLLMLLMDRLPLPDRLFNRMVRMMQQLYPWSMVEVFLLGVLVAIIKLSSMASIIPGPALWALMGTTITLTIVLTFDLRLLVRRRPWAAHEAIAVVGVPLEQVSSSVPGLAGVAAAAAPVEALAGEGRNLAQAMRATGSGPGQQAGASAGRRTGRRGSVRVAVLHPHTAHTYLCARELGVIACHHCDTAWADVREGQHCGHCDAPLWQRKRGGLSVTWALLITAVILYFPANFLPVMTTRTLFGDVDDTILSGVVYFWAEGEWALAAIIFIASFLIPLFKLGALVLLAVLSWRGSLWRLKERTHLYEIVEWVGRWSMLDVFVVAVTSSLIQMPGTAEVLSGPGIAAFGAVVVLTMLATMSFDARLAWDARFRHDDRIRE